ncbi:DUF2306 domain-containing protein [Amycolatopsis vastitatis]|uniref:DUF2306 domain-containing protein n=1 Tax=Amycolatopsis vastitatis TaxID=1905142 RepID=UPI0011782909|nr:DUF2306 domain-containing protein [Amycolatopsis vastitatis]
MTISARNPSDVRTGGDDTAAHRSATAGPGRRRARRSPWPGVLTFLVVAWLLVFVIPAYATLDPAHARIALTPGNPFHYPLLIVHVVSGTVAMLSGCVQIWPRFRRRHPRAHRVSGRVYLAAVVVGAPALAALIFFRAENLGKEPTTVVVGFAVLTLLWAGTAVAGYAAARQRRFADHRKWMLYSFAFTLSIIWSRTAFVAALPFPRLDPRWLTENVGWFPWVLNLLIVQWWLNRTARRPVVVPAGAGDPEPAVPASQDPRS